MEITTAGEAQFWARQARGRAVARVAAGQQKERSRESWQGEDAAIYCRVSHIKDKDQTSVVRQERICRDVVESLGLVVRHVFIDPNRSAWQRDRKRPGWDSLLKVAGNRGIRHIQPPGPERP